jgi:hypothetical protein
MQYILRLSMLSLPKVSLDRPYTHSIDAIVPIFCRVLQILMRRTFGARPTQHAEPIC